MRSTLLYTLMTAALGGVIIYTVHGASTSTGFFALPEFLVAVPVDEPEIIITQVPRTAPRPRAAQAPVQESHTKATQNQAERIHIPVGATQDEVIAMLGKPQLVDETNRRWTYGSHTVLFNDDGVVMGSVQVEHVNAAKARYTELLQLAEAGDAHKPAGRAATTQWKPQGTASRALTRNSTNVASRTGTTNPTGAMRSARYWVGSSRPFTMTNRADSDDYSYYSSNSARLNRFYFRKPALPRGAYRYNGGPIGASRYLPYRSSSGQIVRPNGAYNQPGSNSNYGTYRR